MCHKKITVADAPADSAVTLCFLFCRVANSTRLYNRSKAHLNRTECGESRIPPEWKVERFLNNSNEEEGDGVQETAPPSVTTALLPVLGRCVVSFGITVDSVVTSDTCTHIS